MEENETNEEACRKAIKDVTLKIRLNKLTYGLVYPAFFSHMVYNWIEMMNNETPALQDATARVFSIIAGGFIIAYYLIDYVHLEADLNKWRKEDERSALYIICDICISIALFLAMIFLKNGRPDISLSLFCSTSIFFLAYNWQLKLQKLYHGIVVILLGIFLLLFWILSIYPKSFTFDYWAVLYLIAITAIFSLTYFIYCTYYFWNKKSK